jgi:lipopolysaccharide export system permease protein
MSVPIARLYILKTFARFLALSLFVFASLMLMLNFVGIINHGVLTGFSFYFLFESMAYLLPNILASSLPLAFLLAMLLSLGQMSQDGEIIALRAGGFSFFDILSGVLWTAGLSVLLLVAVNNWFGPSALKVSGDYTESMLTRITKIELKPRTFQQISDWVLYADEVNSLTGGMRGVKLLRRIDKKSGRPAFVTKINAADGHYHVAISRGMGISLANGQFSQTDRSHPENALHGRFASYVTMIPFFSEGGTGRRLGPKELTTSELLARAAAAADADVAARYRVEAYSRFALSLAPLAFFLVGAPLGVSMDKRGRSAGFALTLPIIFFYYGLTITGMVMSRKYAVLFPWAMFVPAVLTAGAGAWLWKRKLYGK